MYVRSPLGKTSTLLGLIVAFGLVCLFSLGLGLKRWSSDPRPVSEQILFRLEKNTGLGVLADNLSKAGLIDNPLFFHVWVRLFGNYRLFQAGTYEFAPGMVSPTTIASKMQTGDVYHPLVLSFTIPEGFTLNQILAKIAESGHYSGETLKKASENPRLRSQFQIKAKTLEGYLYPASYRFYDVLPDPDAVLKAMLTKFFERLPPDIETKLASVQLTLHDAVIIASLIEKETASLAELALVSEVIWRRLQAKIALGIDASIIYGIPNFDGNLTRKHLVDKANLYNLRVHRGLPPGPICSPSAPALEAVFNPANEGNYYYVLLPGLDKRHHFSKTLKEHNKYVAKLVKSQISRN